MAESNQTTPAPASATASAPAAPPAPEFKVPDGKRVLDNAEYERLTRNEERLKGADETIRKYREYGFEKPDDIKPWSGFLKTARERRLDPENLTRAFGADIDAKDDDEAEKPVVDIKAIKNEVISEWKLEQAWERHQSDEAKESDVVRSAIEKVYGKNSEEAEFLTERLVGRLAQPSNRELYPATHVLHKQALAPISEALAVKHAEAMKKADDEKKAARLAAKGDKVRQSSAPGRTPAGNPATSGAPEKKTVRHNGLPDREDVMAMYEARKAARGT